MVRGTRCPAWSDKLQKWSEWRAAALNGLCPVEHRGEASRADLFLRGSEESMRGLRIIRG